MLEISLSTFTYAFAYHFLWYTLSLFHYIDEEVTEENIGKYYILKWDTPFENLAHWATEEWFYLLRNEGTSQEDKDALVSTSGTIGSSLMHYFGDLLIKHAANSHAIQPVLSEPMWVYYGYCRFLWYALKEFDQIMQELGVSSIYYQRYQASINLFHDMAAAMERERPFLDKPDNVDEATMQAVWEEIDATAARLGAEWRQAVLEAAHNQQLPDFISPK